MQWKGELVGHTFLVIFFIFVLFLCLKKKSPFKKASYLSHIWEIYSVSITQAATGGAIEYVVARGLGRRGGRELCWGFFFMFGGNCQTLKT